MYDLYKHVVWHSQPYKKILLVMKLTTLLLLVGILQVSASALAQKVTLHVRNAQLLDVLQQIRVQTGYDFAYTGKDLGATKPVTIDVKNDELADVLQRVFDGQPLDYAINNKAIVVSVKQPSLLDKVKAAQDPDKMDVHGKVVGEDGLSLPGAIVMIKGTGNSRATDSKGEFTLKNVVPGSIIVISFIGYTRQEITVSGEMGTIILKPAENPLDEVEVIAYGQTSERLSTANTSSVTSKVIGEQPVSNPLLALEGRVPGLFITQSSGLSGTSVTVRIQGQNSMGNGNDPLYVVDGTPYTSQLLPGVGNILGIGSAGMNGVATYGSPFSYINPDDIERIDVLKGADATAIYGSRAANGAILITTKKGKAGETRVDLNIQNGWAQVTRQLPLLNTQEYLQMRHEAIANDGSTVQPTDYDINGLWDTTRNTNWEKQLIGGTAQYRDINASVSGGSTGTQYLVSIGDHRQTTVFPGNFADEKISGHFNITSASSNQKFHITFSGSYLADDNRLPSTYLTHAAITLAPDAPPLYNKDGSLNWAPAASGSSSWTNPLAGLYDTYQSVGYNLIANSVISYKLLPNLEFKSSFGYTNLNENETSETPLISTAPELRSTAVNYASYTYKNLGSWIIEPQVLYNTKIGKGALEALAGMTIQQDQSRVNAVNGSNYTSDALLGNVGAAAVITPGTNLVSDYKYNALFGRLNYNLEDKYILNLTARKDGSSRFGADNEFHEFGSVGGAWVFSNEAFFSNHIKFISFGKLRASYGTTGNDQIGDYQFLSLYTPTTAGNPYQGARGLLPGNLSNPYLQWEETKKLEFGLDFGLFKDRVLLSSNYYNNRSSNQLLFQNLPVITGFGSVVVNLPATVENSGWEFNISSTNIKAKDFSWTTGFNITVPQNKLVSFPGLSGSTYANQYVIGQSLSVQRLYHFQGVDPATGVYKVSSTTDPFNPAYPDDATSLVNTFPEFYGGFQNAIHYHQFELDFLFQFTKQKGPNYAFGFVPGTFNTNQPIYVLSRWQKPGDITTIQRYNADYGLVGQYFNATGSDAAYSDASYIRLKNVSLSWQFPEELIHSVHLKTCRINLQAQNLLTITKYKGLDPENESPYALPPLRMITAGIQAGF